MYGHKNMNFIKCRNKNRVCFAKRENDKNRHRNVKKSVRKPNYNKEK